MSDDLVERLKPCPFCGGEAILVMSGDDRSWHWNVICTNGDECGATFQDGERRAVAVETWNRRTDLRAEKAEAENKRLREALAETLEIARRNEAGAYIDRASTVLERNDG